MSDVNILTVHPLSSQAEGSKGLLDRVVPGTSLARAGCKGRSLTGVRCSSLRVHLPSA